MDAKNPKMPSPEASPKPKLTVPTGPAAAAAPPPKKHNRRPPAAGKGRPKGAKNRRTKAQDIADAVAAATPTPRQESMDEVIDKILGLTMPSPVKINGKAVDMRDRLARYLAGDPDVRFTSEQVRIFTFLFAHRNGTPQKKEPAGSKKRSLSFISEGGLPWLNDPMKEQEAKAIAAQQAQQKIEAAAAERKLQGLEPDDPDDDEDPDALQLVR